MLREIKITLIQTLRNHRLLAIVLLSAVAIYVLFPLQLQSGEPYNYASAIEKYYRNSLGFSLAQGNYLPDFGRYHPNHPLGHAIAGWAFDWLKIPAMSWIRLVNTIGSLAAAIFFYIILLRLQFSKSMAVVAVAFFMATYVALFTVLSGEWHIPALALSLAGIWQVFIYIEEGTKRSLYRASFLLALATSYHLVALFYLVPIGLVLLFVRPIKDRWRELLIAGFGFLLLVLSVYVLVPVLLFQLYSAEDFLRTFFVYKYLTHVRYSGFEWIIAAARTIFHTCFYTPGKLKGIDYFVAFFFVSLFFAYWKFYRSGIRRSIKAIILLTPIWWVFTHLLTGARPDGLLGWMFVLPFICLILVSAFANLHPRAIRFLVFLPILTLVWNLMLAILPNSFSKRENIFYFNIPERIPKTTPVAFVVSNPLLMENEIWYAGSELGMRNQMHFMPCCGENNYYSRLKHWAHANPGFILVADGRHTAMENFLQTEGLNYKRWTDRRGDWPSSLVPMTLNVQRNAPSKYEKTLTIWVPTDLLRYR